MRQSVQMFSKGMLPISRPVAPHSTHLGGAVNNAQKPSDTSSMPEIIRRIMAAPTVESGDSSSPMYVLDAGMRAGFFFVGGRR